jgi:hypothetical protein
MITNTKPAAKPRARFETRTDIKITGIEYLDSYFSDRERRLFNPTLWGQYDNVPTKSAMDKIRDIIWSFRFNLECDGKKLITGNEESYFWIATPDGIRRIIINFTEVKRRVQICTS